MALLEIDNLGIGFPTAAGMAEVVRGLSLSVETGEAVGLVGESGSGKSQTALAIMRLLRAPGRITRGSIRLDGHDIGRLDEREMRRLRGGTVSIVFQDALSGLNPVFPIGVQISDVIRAHRTVSQRDARNIAVEMLELVGIKDAGKRLDAYPHEFSGGMRQRVLIAMAVACRPKLLIADEPTTALDVTVQAQIVELLRDLREKLGLALLFITHNLDLMSEICSRSVVLYGGMMMEDSPVDMLFGRPEHPYSKALLDCVPRLEDRPGDLKPIEGAAFSLARAGQGCPFVARCALADDRCETERPPELRRGGHRIACWKAAA
ncbi:ABC transporter ATP-binding protein [Bosea sp. CCNWLW174]|uniref:ABC transporter ATP-binding protein n=1 Tax=unclassified Bosea (in: a-proteobacteria) TaxID=2653178 RepID=UPI003015565D